MKSLSAAETLIFRPSSFVERLKIGELFHVEQFLEVELGSGDGSFMANYAKNHPETNFIGVERLLGRLRKLDRKGARAGLRNLKLIRIEASYLVQWLLPPSSTKAIHLYFPDPWPKRRHWKNRLVNEEFPGLVFHALIPGGTIFLRTDNQDYFDQMLRIFGGDSRFKSVETPEELLAVKTDFERGFNARGIPTLVAAYSSIHG